MKKLIRITTVPISLDKLIGNQLTFMNRFYEVTIVSANNPELKTVAEKYKVKYHHVEMTRVISPLKDFRALYSLYIFLKKEKPHIVHTHTPKAGIVGMMAAKLARVPNRLHTVAGLPLLESTGLKRKLLVFIEKLTYHFATMVYPNSYELKNIILENNFCNPDKVKVIGKGSSNGIDTNFFSKTQISLPVQSQLKLKLGIQSDDFVFIFVGRLVKDKGINELVSAFKELLIENEQEKLCFLKSKLLLVGSFEEKLDPLNLETLIEIQNNPNIISVGFQQEVRSYFAVSNALVFPSYREGFPNVVLQSLAMELPAIVTNINGCNEIVTEGFNGLIVPPKDTESFKEAMKKFFYDSILFEKLKENARQSILPYEQRIIWEALLAEYRALD